MFGTSNLSAWEFRWSVGAAIWLTPQKRAWILNKHIRWATRVQASLHSHKCNVVITHECHKEDNFGKALKQWLFPRFSTKKALQIGLHSFFIFCPHHFMLTKRINFIVSSTLLLIVSFLFTLFYEYQTKQ